MATEFERFYVEVSGSGAETIYGVAVTLKIDGFRWASAIKIQTGAEAEHCAKALRQLADWVDLKSGHGLVGLSRSGGSDGGNGTG